MNFHKVAVFLTSIAYSLYGIRTADNGLATNDRLTNDMAHYTQIENDCFQSFETFAYMAPLDTSTQSRIILPTAELASAIPLIDNPIDWSRFVFPALSRQLNGEEEIWLIGDAIYVYRSHRGDWEVIPRQVTDDIVVQSPLLVTSDGTIWSRLGWRNNDQQTTSEPLPILGRLNENTRRFESVDNELWNRLFHEKTDPMLVHVVLDDNNIFWIVIENRGVFRFDPATGSLEERIPLPNLNVIYIASTDEDSVYFITYEPLPYTGFQMSHYSLYHYEIDENIITEQSLPEENWPGFLGFFVDHLGQLWLGSSGYRDTQGTWHLINPEPELYFDHFGDYMWTPATLIFESSDGKLWFARYLDSSGWAEGIAWYDPTTEQGCLVTNQYSTIVEDSEGRLWLTANGNLYVMASGY